jgi:hypothetical protein
VAALIKKIREITDKPIKYVVLTHYHAVRVLGASLQAQRLEQIIASQDTWDLIVERGQQDMDSEIGRFPRLFQAVRGVPGLTWPTLTFQGEMTLWLGKLEVKIRQIVRPHQERHHRHTCRRKKSASQVTLVEADAACYTGDAYLADWPQTLDRLAAMKFDKLVPDRITLMTPEQVQNLAYTRDFTPRSTRRAGGGGPGDGSEGHDGPHRKAMDPKFAQVFIYEHCLPST